MEKFQGIIAYMDKIAASVNLKLFISGNEILNSLFYMIILHRI